MQFSQLAAYFGRIEKTSLRNEKTTILAELFKELTSEEVGQVAYLSVGRLGPLYDPLEFGLAGKMVVRAVSWGTGKTGEEVTALYKIAGDLGEVVSGLKTAQSVDQSHAISPSISEVFQELTSVAKDGGKGSQERKIEKLGKLLKALGAESSKYVVRLIMGKLRLGFSDLTILDSLSWSATGGKADRGALEHAYNVWSDMGAVAQLYKTQGVEGLLATDVVPGRPVKPMRAERLGTIREIVAKLVTFAVEPKYDGMRVQIHAYQQEEASATKDMAQEGLFAEESNSVTVKIFSRGLEDITHMFPDVVASARALQSSAGDFVIDGEALGIDLSTGTFLSFQETIKRKRKHDVDTAANNIPLSIQLFDVLYGEGSGRLSETYSARRTLLANLIQQSSEKIFHLAESTVVTTAEEAQKLFDLYMHDRLEGMLCKRLDSHYLAGARNFNWVKYKRAHEEGLVDTIDCVVMGYYAGKGKRMQFGVGAFLVGVQGGGGQIVTVAKIGTGLTDVQFRELYSRMQPIVSSGVDSRYVVAQSLAPDVWVSPSVVVEIQSDEITKSPIHSAGYALRFPRLVTFRDDKGLDDITTVAEVEHLFGLI